MAVQLYKKAHLRIIAARTGQLPIFVLKASENSICRVVCLVVLKFISYFTRSQSPPRSTLSSIPVLAKYNGGQTFLSENFLNARKWKSMILSEHALIGNGD